ncbi:malate dehydrogenase [Penicillium hispanicum]|uniref:malate dehydrogenase n=1 Tax=Penicillium hispanicum TaxID=1080232 RepID=UPI002540F7BB|nr:malate dehydrogenase [Penicillium hispanicum]KAJ5570361.1 malate dehydrogenase [Penicillium hispanicum]
MIGIGAKWYSARDIGLVHSSRSLEEGPPRTYVVVLGASGGIGQPLSLLLKACPLVDELALYDVVNTPGVAADLSHISSVAVRLPSSFLPVAATTAELLTRLQKISGYLPKDDGLKHALTGADIVVIPAGIPRKPGMTRDDLFKINAGIVRDLVKGIAEFSPKAFTLVISNPVNSTVPIAAEVLKAAGVFDPKRLFGVTTLDVVRAETFTQEFSGLSDPSKATVPVIGGHSGETIVPLFSKVSPDFQIPADRYDALVNRVQFGGDEVVKAKDGAGSATLSMAFAGFRFAEAVIKATKGEKGIIEPTFVYLPGVSGGEEIAKTTGLDFFSTPVELGPNGAEKAINIIDGVTETEQKLLDACIKGLKGNIEKGVDFIKNPPPK